jgi:hypothetical protein
MTQRLPGRGGVENINGAENINDVKDKSDESTFEAVPSGGR